MQKLASCLKTLAAVAVLGIGAAATAAEADLKAPFSWTLGPPLISPAARPGNACISVKDPTVVFAEGRWHVFMTVRCGQPPVNMEYVSFDKWENADKAPRHVFTWYDRYFCAPQVFYFRPHKKWYLVYQVGEPSRKLQLQPAYATTEKIGDPASWSPGKLFFPETDPKSVSRWIDFWVICDDKRAYLFFTSNNGNMWRMWTTIEKFPEGFDHCELALKADIFEAGHTYRLAGQEKYLTVVEAQGKEGRRYYKAYTADRLDGAWQPLADTEDRPFAGAANVRQPDPAWADNISHGELIRAGSDETMTVDPAKLQFLIQGVNNNAKGNKGYGGIPWRLGLLTPESRP
jgi:hypothetical protein